MRNDDNSDLFGVILIIFIFIYKNNRNQLLPKKMELILAFRMKV